MTFREANLKIFNREEIPYVLFQPRIEPWYWWHTKYGVLPEKYRGLSLLELFDTLKISMRYPHYYTGQPDPVEVKYTGKVEIRDNFKDDESITVIETPYGELVRRVKKTSEDSWRIVEFPVRTKDDFKKLIWLYENTTYSFSKEKFETASKFIGSRGYPQFFVPRSPYQCLCLEWMKLEDFIYALTDYTTLVEDTMKAIDNSYDNLYHELTSYDAVKIINFGENIDAFLLSPKYFEQYLIPFYEKRVKQFKKSGIYTYIHIDGHFKPLLKYLRYLPVDGIEALTPQPQGDVSVEEMKEYIGDKILIDGIPAIIFLPQFPEREFMEYVEKLIHLFLPNIILGISDELPMNAPAESIDRVKIVSEYCQKYKPQNRTET